MRYVPAGEFRTHCYKWIEHLRSTREHVVITKRGVPIAKVVPLRAADHAACADDWDRPGARPRTIKPQS